MVPISHKALTTTQKVMLGSRQAGNQSRLSAEDVVPDVAQAIFNNGKDPYSPDMVGGMIGKVGEKAGTLWMVHDMLLPGLVMGATGAANIGKKVADKMGATNTASRLSSTAKFVSEKTEAGYFNKPIASLKSGEAIAGAVHSVVNPVYKIANKFNSATNLFSGFANRTSNKSEFLAGQAMSLAGTVRNIPEELSHALSGLVNVKFGDHAGLKAAQGAVNELLAHHEHAIPKPDYKAVKKTITLNGKAHALAQKSVNWSELATGQHHTLENVKHTSLHQGVSGGLLSIASVGSVVGTTTETLSDVKMFRQLVADITGKDVKDVNSGDALFANLPHAGEVARQALLISAAPRMILEGINTVFNIKMIKGSHIGMLTFMAPMLGSQAIGMLTSGNILDTYKQMKRNEVQGQENLPDQYAALIGMSHKGLHQRGGSGSNFAQELGRIYAERHATVKEVLQAVGSGQIDKEIEAIVAHNSAEEKSKSQPVPTPTSEPVTSLQQVNAVQPNALANPFQSVIDKFEKSADASFADRVTAPQHSHQPVRQ